MSSIIVKQKVAEDLLDEQINSSYSQLNMSGDFKEKGISEVSCPGAFLNFNDSESEIRESVNCVDPNSADSHIREITEGNNSPTLKLNDSNISKRLIEASDEESFISISDKNHAAFEDENESVHSLLSENEVHLNNNSSIDLESGPEKVEHAHSETENVSPESDTSVEEDAQVDSENHCHLNNNSFIDVEITEHVQQDSNINDKLYSDNENGSEDLLQENISVGPIGLPNTGVESKTQVINEEINDSASSKVGSELQSDMELEADQYDNINKKLYSDNENGSEGSEDLLEEDILPESKELSNRDFDMEPHIEIITDENVDSPISKVESQPQSDMELNEEHIPNADVDNCVIGSFSENFQKKKKQKCKRRRRILERSDESEDSSKDSKESVIDLEEALTPPVTTTASSPPLCIVDSIIKDLPKEKPKPKSKKQSTILLKQIETQKLLQNAIIISAGPSIGKVSDSSESENEMEKKQSRSQIYKCNKRKILESSSEESDIELRTLITEPLPEEEQPEPHTDTVPDIVMDVFLPEDLSTETMEVDEHESTSEQSDDEEINVTSPNEIPTEDLPIEKAEQQELNIDKTDTISEIDKNESTTEDSSSSESDSHIPNEVYFGTPDNTVNRPNTAKCSRGRNTSRRGQSFSRNNDCGTPRNINSEVREIDSFISYIQAAGRKPQPVVKKPIEKAKPIEKIKIIEKPIESVRRYSDSDTDSRSIPNEIYFGDVKVVKTVQKVICQKQETCRNSSSDSESSSSYKQFNSSRGAKVQSYPRNNYDARKRVTTNKNDIDTFKSYIQAAGIKVKYNKLFEGCTTERQKIDAMLYQLQCYGLKGEPTYTKCRRLRPKVSVKREISELDTSVIIETSGRTLRSARGLSTTTPQSKPIYIDDDQQQKTLSVIKSLVDSDSD